MNNQQNTMFSGRGFDLTPEEILEIKHDVKALTKSTPIYAPTFKWKILDDCVKNNFIELLNEISFYKNITSFQSCPKKLFLEKVVSFIDNNNVRFWDCADWMHQYLIDKREQFETYHDYDGYNQIALLEEINNVINENLRILYD